MASPDKIDFRKLRELENELRALQAQGEIISKEARQFRKLIDNAKTEREVAPFLRQRPQLVAKLADASYPCVFKEFPIGTRHPDFVVLDPYSAAWDVVAIELEPPNVKLFTKAGTPTKRLVGAVKQVDDWRNYFTTNRQEVLRRLSDYWRDKDLLGRKRTSDLTDCNGLPLADPRSRVFWKWMIVIGRRHELSEPEREATAMYRENHGIHIASYDRIVEILDHL